MTRDVAAKQAEHSDWLESFPWQPSQRLKELAARLPTCAGRGSGGPRFMRASARLEEMSDNDGHR